MDRVAQTGVGEASSEEIAPGEHLRERLFTGLRLAEGVDLAVLERELDLPVRARFAKEIDGIVRDGLGIIRGDVLVLSERGLDLHTEVSLRFF